MYESTRRNKQNSDSTDAAPGWLRNRVRALLLVVLALILVSTLMPMVAAAENLCANEDLRSTFGQIFLPDCRAYEMVSPSYKEGYPIFLAEHAIASEKAILSSLGNLDAYGDSESPLRGVLYLDTRTPSGWRTVPLNAPSSEFVGEYPITAEPESGETLWEQHTPRESVTMLGLYARSIKANPPFRFIGPLNIPFEGEPKEPSTATNLTSEHLTLPVAATGDYSHVIMEGAKEHWPLDATPAGRPSVYEYSGIDNAEPVLVGASGEEKGNTELIGRCGTLLGGGGSTYNALSSDGEAVFFTVLSKSECGESAPATNTVYARVNGALDVPGAAKSVNVSASECTVGGPECMDKSGKNFEGASEDGHRVFFTSTQKLTNDAMDATASGDATEGGEVGKCVRMQNCNLYEYRFESTENHPPRLAAGRLHLVSRGDVSGVAGIAEDGSRIYFVSQDVLVGAGANEYGKNPEGSHPNLYVYDTVTEKTVFIATLAESDEEAWQRGFAGRTAEVGGRAGQYLLFESTAHLTPDDSGGMRQLFEYDAVANELVRVTKGEDDYAEDGNSVSVGVPLNLMVNAGLQLGGGIDFKSQANRLNMSSDGRTVVFATGGQLSARAKSAEARAPGGPCRSLYEFHSAGALSEGTVHLLSDGRETQVINGQFCGAEFQAMDASGGDIMFESVDPLVMTDIDGGQRDIYDAHVDGGFARPGVDEYGRCGSGCEGTSSVSPVFDAPASANNSGEAPLPTRSKKASARKPHKAKKKGKERRRKRKAHRSSVVFAHTMGR